MSFIDDIGIARQAIAHFLQRQTTTIRHFVFKLIYRKRALKHKIRFYEDILFSIPHDLVVFDHQHRYLFLNDKAISDPDMRRFMINKTDYDYCIKRGLPIKLADDRRNHIETAVKKKEVHSFDDYVKNKVIKRNYVPIFSGNNLKYVLGYGIDVSQIREIENSVKQKNEELKQLSDFSFLGIGVTDHEMNILEWNQTAELITGYTEAEMKGYCLAQTLMSHKFNLEVEKSGLCKRYILSHDLLNRKFEVDFRHRNGTSLYVEIIIKPFKSFNKERYAIFFLDRTRQKITEKELLSIASFPEENPNPIFRIEIGTMDILYTNPSCRSLFPDKEDLKKLISVTLKEGIVKLIGGDPSISVEVILQNRYYSVNMVRGIEKNYINAYCVDVTAIKEAEFKVKNYSRVLEKQVNARTSELIDSNKNLESFAYTISHDLRAPIRHVSAYTKLLQKDNPNPTSKFELYISTIQSSCKKMEKQIDSLLQFSRYGTMALNKSEFDIIDIFNKTIEIYKAFYQTELNYVNKVQTRFAYGDPSLIQVVIDNLISNAIKYSTRSDEIYVEIGCKTVEQERVFYVKDKGAGFDMAYYDKIFGVFQRLHTDDQFEGMGIGLSNVQRIMQRHGGRIWAESEPGKGSTFYFSLPTDKN